MKWNRLRRAASDSGRRRRRRARAGAGALAAVRVGLGVGMAVRPESMPRALGVDAVSARRMSWIVRMCAVRDAALGAGGCYAAATGRDLRPWLLAQSVSDAGDVAAIALAVRERRVSAVPGIAVAATAAAAFVGGLFAARTAGQAFFGRPVV